MDDKRILNDQSILPKGDHLAGKQIDLCVTGGIGAVESVKLAREFRRYGASVRAFLSSDAQQFIGEMALEWGTANKVHTGFSAQAEHVDKTDLILVCPATLNTINKFRFGIADTLILSHLASGLGAGIPILFVPTMHGSLWKNPILQDSISYLRQFPQIQFLAPHLSEDKIKVPPVEEITWRAIRQLSKSPIKNKKILLLAGPTRAYLDPVRHLSNRSTGELGCKIALEAFLHGADVTMIYGPAEFQPPNVISIIRIETVTELKQALFQQVEQDDYDVVIFAAAILDHQPKSISSEKLPSDRSLTLELEPLPKLIQEIDRVKKRFIKVGFKLEVGKSEQELRTLADKVIEEKRIDLLIINDLHEINQQQHKAYLALRHPEKSTHRSEQSVCYPEPEGGRISSWIPLTTKSDIARELVEKLAALMSFRA